MIVDNTNGGSGRMALTKIGTGTIGIPTAMNTYSGPTIVNNGILEFTATGAPSPNSDHQINSPGKLKLSFLTNKSVNSLFINGVKQPAGDYDANSHPDFITGPGTLSVVELHPPVTVELSVTRSAGNLTVTWTGCGLLQESSDLTNWTDLPGVSSPYTTPATAARKYFRVQ